MSIESVMTHTIQPSHPLSSPSPLAFSLSQHLSQGLFQWVSSSYQVVKVLELQLQQQSFQWIFRTDFLYNWLDLLEVQRTLKSLQHHSAKASFLWCSGFFMVHLSHLCMTSGKTIALARWTFVGKVISLLFDMLSWLVIAFLQKSKRLLISWLQPPSAVILEPKNIKSVTAQDLEIADWDFYLMYMITCSYLRVGNSQRCLT